MNKICTKCKIDKEPCCFYSKKDGKYGLSSQCKSCVLEGQKKYYNNNKDKVAETNKKWVRKNKDKVREIHSKWVAANKDKNNEHKRKWLENNPEKRRESVKTYCDNNKDKKHDYYLKNKEHSLLAQKQRYEDNKEGYLAQCADYYQRNKEAVKKRVLAYAKNNPIKISASNSKRRCDKLKRTPIWSELEDIKDVYAEARYFQMEVDHIIPLQGKLVSGLHVWDNLQLLSKSDNCKKSNKFNIEEQR